MDERTNIIYLAERETFESAIEAGFGHKQAEWLASNLVMLASLFSMMVSKDQEMMDFISEMAERVQAEENEELLKRIQEDE